MPYRIRVTDTAKLELRRLPGNVRQRARRPVESLAENPSPSRAKELRGLPGRCRVPLLDWRIIYGVDKDAETVLVLTIRRKTGPETYQDIE
jgi:mRNA-degrading endonuclease RelE of RelBE toxin-antitoxin system